ncbi:MAG: hypothetical protein ACLGJC_13445 [Alphaproteobacteria bacterium]
MSADLLSVQELARAAARGDMPKVLGHLLAVSRRLADAEYLAIEAEARAQAAESGVKNMQRILDDMNTECRELRAKLENHHHAA